MPGRTEEVRCRRSEPNGSEEMEAGIGIDRLAVDGPRIVLGNVDDLRGGRRDLDVALVLDDFLLRSGLEVAGLLGAIAHDLDGLHYVLRLVVVGVAEVGGPLQVLRHLVEDLGEGGEGFDAGVPAGLRIGAGGDLLRRRATLHVEPLVGGGDLRRIGGSREDHGDEIVRVEGDGGDHLLEAVGSEGLGGLVGRGEALGWIVVGCCCCG